MAVSNSQGTTLKFTPEGGTQVTVGKLTSVGEIQPEAEEIDITTLDSEGGYREFMQGFRDSGEVELSGYHDAKDAGQKAVREAFTAGKGGAFAVSGWQRSDLLRLHQEPHHRFRGSGRRHRLRRGGPHQRPRYRNGGGISYGYLY